MKSRLALYRIPGRVSGHPPDVGLVFIDSRPQGQRKGALVCRSAPSDVNAMLRRQLGSTSADAQLLLPTLPFNCDQSPAALWTEQKPNLTWLTAVQRRLLRSRIRQVLLQVDRAQRQNCLIARVTACPLRSWQTALRFLASHLQRRRPHDHVEIPAGTPYC